MSIHTDGPNYVEEIELIFKGFTKVVLWYSDVKDSTDIRRSNLKTTNEFKGEW